MSRLDHEYRPARSPRATPSRANREEPHHGSGLTFEDAGEHELKGVPDRWHLYRVVSG